MGFLGMSLELSAIDDGMKSAIGKASDLLNNINEMIHDQFNAIRKIKKEDFFKGIKSGAQQAIKSIKDLSFDFKSFSNLLDKVGKKSYEVWKKFGDGIKKVSDDSKKHIDSMMKRVTQFNIANMASNMKTLTGETGNLTNSLEATMTSLIQTTKPIAATLDLSGKEMKKFAGQAASMAYSMNTSADAVAETMRSIHIANKGATEAMNELGLSTKDWVKVVQTTNVPMSEYTAILGDMTTSWQASPKEAANMIDSLMAIGKAAGTGTGAVKNAKVQLDELGEVFKTLPPSMARTSDEIMSLMQSSARMSGVFREMGDTQEEAITKANTVARMFAEQDVAIRKALNIGDERALMDNPLLKYLMRLGIGFDSARKIIETGSRDVVAGMKMVNNVYARFGTDVSPQVQRALSGLSGALGEGAAGLSYLATNTKQGTAALDKMANMSVVGSGALKKFGKDAYSSGLTLQETYDRAKESFDTTIRSISRGDVRGLVRKQIEGMRQAGKELKKLGSDETWGPWINALSRFRQMGVGGIFSSVAESTGVGAENAAKFGTKAGLIFDTVSQLGGEIAPLMHLFGMTGPLGPLIAMGGLGALLAMDEATSKKILGSFYDTFASLKKMLLGVWDVFTDKFVSIWDNTIAPKISEIWSEMLLPYLEETTPRIGKVFLDAFKWAWDAFWRGDMEQALLDAERLKKTGVSGLSDRKLEEMSKRNEKVIEEETKNINSLKTLTMGMGGISGGYALMYAPESRKIEKVEESQKAIERQKKFRRDLEKYGAPKADIFTDVAGVFSDWSEGAKSGGTTTGDSFVEGITDSLKKGKDVVDKNAGYVAEGVISESPIKSGPLAGEKENNAAYRGGYFTMEQFALGITDSTDMIKRVIEDTLADSVILTIDTYAEKMRDLAEQKMFLASVAKAMVKDLGGNIETSIDSESDINVKKNFEAAMNLPGLASVVLAVSNEGAQTRKLLKRILEENIRQTSVMSGGVSIPVTGTTTPPPS
jgi:methyl-accepting chemotaxis protein